MKNTAIILAAGSGKRMNGEMKKQFIQLKDKPLLFYSLYAFENSLIDDIVLVTGEGDIEYCKENIVKKYNMQKVSQIISGGSERYYSVYHGLSAINNCKNVLIHDGARPLITIELINKIIENMQYEDAVILGVPVKDTIKQLDEQGYVLHTPIRESLWSVQTPQAFDFKIIKDAYSYVINNKVQNITDDAMVLESYPNANTKIKILHGSYNNLKVTTPEDIKIIESLMI